ncbi:LutC/YkgG family protein [Zoogloea dura]|uniref:LUD domain-containing protein n=1 Tax=Zoogloea dura TaxID=2728840 RepID=A0A848G3N4_9RHOO|nr:LUD domain-containing protein [Zoogloea dura]NML25043.1 LUD domain-containing protein [Zoogloea dura]
MPDSRDTILARIRAGLGRGPLPAAAGAALDARPAHTRIAFDDDLTERFITKLCSRAGSVNRLASLSEVPAAVDAYGEAHGLPPRAAVARPLAGLPWPAGLARHEGPAGKDEILSVTACLAGIAETGSILLASGPDSPTTLNFVPDHHLVVLLASQLVPDFEAAWAHLRALPGGMPRTVNIVSGPSRTGDVGLTLQLGAHGPRSLHVLLVGGDT